MYIKSIILDGFKSYGQRTVVGPFDCEFNAITGLNGTGKSNILDSICFVLGITNLSQVRAASLQDLIYKSGQAGIRKASVSLVFDNSVAAQSAPGFEHMKELTITRQVEMGGKTKYLLNGHVAQHKKVQDLFCSVQLNVNNPNFLVMQGKITKVLNMKPVEILSMIEEAAGTRMYQKKREDCVKLMQKKNAKLQELIAVISEEVKPKLNQLREERSQYDEYCKLEREAEHLMRLYEAWQLCIAQKSTATSKIDMEKGHAKIQEIKDKMQHNRDVIAETEEQIEEAHKKARAEEASKLAELEGRLKEREKLEIKLNGAEKAAQEAIADEEKNKKQLEKQLKNTEKDLMNKETELNNVKDMFEEMKHNDQADSEALAASERRFEAISAGMEINEEGKAETLHEQLMNARSTASEAKGEHLQAAKMLAHAQQQLKEKEQTLATTNPDTGDHKERIVQVQREIKSLESQLSKLNYAGDDQRTQLHQRRQQLKQQSGSLRNRIDNFLVRRPFTTFRYTDPTPNFDRRQVYGPICRLIKVKDPLHNFALEIAGGGRLYEVVVDNENVSHLLIHKGNLQNRTTFVPMNKIIGSTIRPDVLKFAQSLVGTENVIPAISLISYNKKFQTAMEYAFGGILICKDLDMAKLLAFHPRVQKKCVTIGGDAVDPAGVFEGGAAPKEEPMLKCLEEIMAFEEQWNKTDDELKAVERQMGQMEELHRKWIKLSDDLGVKQHELGVLEKMMHQTTYYQLQEDVQNLKQEIASLNDKIKESKEIEQKFNAKTKDLEAKLKDSKGYKAQLLKQAEKEMKQLEQKAEQSRKKWKKHEQTYEVLLLEISELKKEVENLKKQIEVAEQNLVELKEKLEEAKNEANAVKEEVAKLQGELKAEKQANAEKNRELQKSIQKKEQLLAQISEMELQLKKLQYEVNKLDESYKLHTAKEKEYSKKCKNENVLKEAQALSEHEGRELEKRIRHSQERRNALSRVVNAKAQSMYEHHEKQYNDIQNKIKVLERDKNKIEQAIVTMDERKRDTIVKAHQQVTRDFGSIFSTLLPGSNAELRAPHGKTVWDGLEVKVSLGGVWKDNLSELSGGQRSLAALSLILAILLFKPAPLYILDEVDAALDLSHTQNIGNMLKTHFRQSQFIVVSLKDGMFNNANVLFRTQFIDGVSAVTRSSA